MEGIGFKSGTRKLIPWIDVFAERVYDLTALLTYGEVEIIPIRDFFALAVPEVNRPVHEVPQSHLFPVQFRQYLAKMIAPPVELAPNRVPCGPFKTETDAMSNIMFAIASVDRTGMSLM